MPKPYNPRSRRGQATIRNHGAAVIAARARSQFIANRLKDAGLNPDDMSPEELEAFRKRALQDSIARARAAKAMKRAVRIAEEEAAAEAWAAKQAMKDAQRAARRAERAEQKAAAIRATAAKGSAA